MVALVPELRKILENRIPEARQAAEEAARAVLNTLAVNRADPFPGMMPEQRRLRNALRAKARQLGGGIQIDGFDLLVEELAYQQWHHMVFARFLAENNLLMHPSGVAVSLQDCADLANDENEADAWAVAAKYATLMLPGIFRAEDPATNVRLAPEGQQKLEIILNGLPSATFHADDALGWMYQFWQSRKKDEINKSERKIGGADISPVTQLFTEDYMVRFLLENTLGAWWAARHPESQLTKEWTFLRCNSSGIPTVPATKNWPDRIAEIKVIDPCCGSGHFLVAAFDMLYKMRTEEEELSKSEAIELVLLENLFGLEIDLRCSQIASFSVILAAWKQCGYKQSLKLNIACSGIPVRGQKETWINLAKDDINLRQTLEHLYTLFENANYLGSLIDPSNVSVHGPLFKIDFSIVQPLLEKALSSEKFSESQDLVSRYVAEDISKAAFILSNQYTLVITNVPFLSRGRQADELKEFCDLYYPKSKGDLATVFVERCSSLCSEHGTIAIVTPQYWLFLSKYRKLREPLLKTLTWSLTAKLGSNAFETIGGEVVNIALIILNKTVPTKDATIIGVDLNNYRSPFQKAEALQKEPLLEAFQNNQLKNPDASITLSKVNLSAPLSDYADSYHGISTTDYARFGRCFWELPKISDGWILQQSTVVETVPFGGREHILFWQNGQGELRELSKTKAMVVITGLEAWDKEGIAVSQMGNLPVTLYTGGPFDDNTAVIIPKKIEYLPAIWAFCKSIEFSKTVRQFDQSLKVTYPTLVKIPFDYEQWKKIADQDNLITKPHSNDPTQSVFNTDLFESSNSLQVAVANLLGYQWPNQKIKIFSDLIDDDGLLCLPSVFGESTASDILRSFLSESYGKEWSPAKQANLLAQAGVPEKSLEDWLRDDFFAQHCKLFQNRPFIWHIWDGRKDGFSALVNSHKLTSGNLDRLIYTYLGDWINFQRARRDHGEPGADGRLVAALQLQEKLKLIREGEPPYDIYVRWKSLAEQPIGWNPDLNDGVRINIRPFVEAGVLRSKFNINWNKDRGKNPDGSERLNDLHFTRAEKEAARKQAGKVL